MYRRRYDNPIAFILSAIMVLLLEKGLFSLIDNIKRSRAQINNNRNAKINEQFIKDKQIENDKQTALSQFNIHCNFLKESLSEIGIIEGEDYNELNLKDVKFYDNLIETLNKKLKTPLKVEEKQKYIRTLNAVKNTKEKYIVVKNIDDKYINIINKLK